MYDSDPADLIEFATRWRELGDAVTEQVARVIDDPSCGSCWNEGTEHGVNPTAIEVAYQRLRGVNEGIDEALSAFLESVAE
ncbi:MAG: hypothetical protein K0U98_06020 [Deltaproteobacteria bacterium]|nr:hypothetical protein [Deltaproteobacteria bacterium]